MKLRQGTMGAALSTDEALKRYHFRVRSQQGCVSNSFRPTVEAVRSQEKEKL